MPTTEGQSPGPGLPSLALCPCPSPSPTLQPRLAVGGVSPRSWPRPPAPRLAQCRPRPHLGPHPLASVSHQWASFGPGPHLQGSIYLNDFARVVSSDHEAVNGVLHFIDRVLLPPDVLHWEPDAAPVLRV